MSVHELVRAIKVSKVDDGASLIKSFVRDALIGQNVPGEFLKNRFKEQLRRKLQGL